jgi:hypothetical protein
MRHRSVGLSLFKLGLCLIVPCFAQALAQVQPQIVPPAEPPENNEPGAIQGTVLSDATGQPLRRAQVQLRPVDAANGGSFQTTDENGSFSFPKVARGRYSITVQRDGYLPLASGRIGAYKMPPIFLVRSGQTIESFVFRLAPWGVISGKVKFDDAEPAVNVQVQLYREYYDRGRHGYAVAASGRTDDRGEYRLHGLEPGSYYVAALYQSPARPPDVEEQLRADPSGKLVPDLSYAVTFFPEVHRMADAVPVRLGPGQEAGGIDIFLTLVHTVRVHGRVTSGLSGKLIPDPNITLRWNDPDNTASVSAPVNVTLDSGGNFEMKGVTPGPYLVLATGADEGTTLTGRVPVNVGDSDIASLDLVIGPESNWKGKIQLDGDDSSLPAGLVVALEPRRPTASPTRASQVSATGEFSIPYVPNETYDLYVLNGPDSLYLKSVGVANADRLGDGLEAAPGDAPPPLDVRLSTHGGQVVGRAVTTDPDIVASGASVALIPDPPSGRVQAYRTTSADEYGSFLFQGIAPGMYIVVAWLDQVPCQIYNPADLPACRAQGIPLMVPEGAAATIQATAN